MLPRAKIELKSVDDYIAAQPEPTARALELVGSAIRKGLPKAEEVISYKMPAYKLHGKIVLYFAGSSTIHSTRSALHFSPHSKTSLPPMR